MADGRESSTTDDTRRGIMLVQWLSGPGMLLLNLLSIVSLAVIKNYYHLTEILMLTLHATSMQGMHILIRMTESTSRYFRQKVVSVSL